MNIALYQRKSETREQCMGGKVKLYDLKKKKKAENANAVDMDADPNRYIVES